MFLLNKKRTQSWFEDCDHIVIDTADLDLSTVSFTYGDSHPTYKRYKKNN
ncbi:hypothetical protein [Butyrivibrio sp. NC2002]|nr:hypothetical protein [Butyrivibrio sp. NC2002]